MTATQQSSLLKDYAVAVHLQQLHCIPGVEMAGTKLFTETFLAEARQMKDPVEQLLLSQLLLVSYRLGGLHLAAAGAETLEASRIHTAAAARLMAELRRMALALKKYREPVATSRAFSVIHQQNVSTVERGQEVQYIDRSAGEEKDSLMMSRSRLSGNDTNEGENDEHDAKPAARGGRPNHRPVAAAVDG